MILIFTKHPNLKNKKKKFLRGGGGGGERVGGAEVSDFFLL